MKPLPQRFYSLDVLRGLGALAVVIVHWGNFDDYPGLAGHPAPRPFNSLLQPIYMNGWRAVDMFFCLSGFVFFWLYSQKIQSRQTSAREFTVLRLSRLYPLHLATLLLVAAGQPVMGRQFGSPPENYDLIHFVGQLFFSSGWWGIPQISFNGPAWSVSVEILLYALFFLLCRLHGIRWWHLLAYAVLGEFWVIHHGNCLLIARGVMSFFLGGLAFRVFGCLHRRSFSAGGFRTLAAATLLLWILIPWEAVHHSLFAGYQLVFGHVHWPGFGFLGRGVLRLSEGSYELVLFPLTLITLALWETRRGTLGRRVAVLGDLSYSTYLLHYPLQIFFMIAVFALGVPGTFFGSPWAFLLYFAVLIPVSLCSYHFLERPAQAYLRSHLLPPAKAKRRPET